MRLTIERSTNPNTGEEVRKVRASVNGESVPVLTPALQGGSPEEVIELIQKMSNPQCRLEENQYGKYIMVFEPQRIVEAEFEIAGLSL